MVDSGCFDNLPGGGILVLFAFFSSSRCNRGDWLEYHHCRNFNMNSVTGRAVLRDDSSKLASLRIREVCLVDFCICS